MNTKELQLPPEWPETDMRLKIKTLNESRKKKIIVLDDDPTGVQTVHDIDVLTQWDIELLRETFHKPETVFYILTNTRGHEASAAEQINREIAQNVFAVAKETNKEFVFISRSDSTLRGYYPLEIDVLSEEINRSTQKEMDGHLIIPAFFEGGRVTYQNTHYIVDGETMVPVHQTEFAKDKVFGYQHGDLTLWVEEKTEGRLSRDDCVVLTLDQIRSGPEAVEEVLMTVQGNKPVIINCMSYSDLDVLSLALLHAEGKGKRFMFRTGASFVKSYAGIETQAPLPKEKLIAIGQETHGGLVVVGSYVQKSTRQLQQLLDCTEIVSLELDVQKMMDDHERQKELERLSNIVNESLVQGRNVVVYSSRKLLATDNKKENIGISQIVSASLVKMVQTLKVIPKFIIAKGGITSSDVATKGLGIQKARVLGQAAAGIPVWLTGEEAKFPGIPYIVFPGNVGNDRTLLEIIQKIES